MNRSAEGFWVSYWLLKLVIIPDCNIESELWNSVNNYLVYITKFVSISKYWDYQQPEILIRPFMYKWQSKVKLGVIFQSKQLPWVMPSSTWLCASRRQVWWSSLLSWRWSSKGWILTDIIIERSIFVPAWVQKNSEYLVNISAARLDYSTKIRLA